MPKISIVIPVYNASRFLRATVDSVRRQTETDIEIICVDDCSTDGSLSVLEELARLDPRIRVIRMETNSASPGTCRNVGIRAAGGEYVGFVDSDDEVDEDYFGTLYRIAKEADADVAASLRIVLFGEGRPDAEWLIDCRGWHELRSPRQKSWLTRCSGSNWNKIFRREMLTRNGLSCCEWKRFGPEDNFLTLTAVIMADKVVVTDAVAYRYRQHETNLTRTAKRDGDIRLIELYQSVDGFIDEHVCAEWLRDEGHRVVRDRVAYDVYHWRRSLSESARATFDAAFRNAYPELAETVMTADREPGDNVAFPPPRLLFVINQLYKGGAESSLVTFIRGIDPSKYEVTLVVYNQSARGPAVSLLDRIPATTQVYVGKTPVLTPEVRAFVSERHFDLAVSVGEWQSPELVMRYANADKKAIWLHADISSPQIPRAWDLFAYTEVTDAWICVSNVQRDLFRQQCPFLADRVFTVHNPIDIETVARSAKLPVTLPSVCQGRKIVVMVGNLRPAKNYIRAVRTASELNDRGVDAVWLIAGGLNDLAYVAEVRREISRLRLEDRFVLLGAQENPWKFVAKADVFVSTSDTESWCMAVSEATQLGIPVVATTTDGVSEQIFDGQNGFLCQFNETDLANRLRSVLVDGVLKRRDPNDVTSAPPAFDTNAEFDKLFIAPPPFRERAKTLFVIDDANYRGGAHKSTMRMLKAFRDRGEICDVFSGVVPSLETLNEYFPLRIRCSANSSYARWFDRCGFREVVGKSGIPVGEKFRKLKLSVSRRFGLVAKPDVGNGVRCGPEESAVFGEYECVCVMSEGSVFRKAVSELPSAVRKIQFIHTFYAHWRNFNDWTREVTKDDGRIYADMDRICLIGNANVSSFCKLYPSLSAKTVAFHNVVECPSADDHRAIRIVTVARLEAEKDFPRAIRIARTLLRRGLRFEWNVYGDGSARAECELLIRKFGIGDSVCFCGYDRRPFDRMREADLFVLLSHYEGLPNVIYESMMVGTPVFSTDVGGIAEQVEAGENGMLVPDDEAAIVEGLAETLANPELISKWKRNLKHYRYDNGLIVNECLKLIK